MYRNNVPYDRTLSMPNIKTLNEDVYCNKCKQPINRCLCSISKNNNSLNNNFKNNNSQNNNFKNNNSQNERIMEAERLKEAERLARFSIIHSNSIQTNSIQTNSIQTNSNQSHSIPFNSTQRPNKSQEERRKSSYKEIQNKQIQNKQIQNKRIQNERNPYERSISEYHIKQIGNNQIGKNQSKLIQLSSNQSKPPQSKQNQLNLPQIKPTPFKQNQLNSPQIKPTPTKTNQLNSPQTKQNQFNSKTINPTHTNNRYERYSFALSEIESDIKKIKKPMIVNDNMVFQSNQIDYSNKHKTVLPISVVWSEILTYYFATFRGDEKQLEAKLRHDLADYDYSISYKHIKKDKYIRYMKRSIAQPELESGGFVEKCTKNHIHLYTKTKKWKINRMNHFIFVYKYDDKIPIPYEGSIKTQFRVKLEHLKQTFKI